MERDDPAYRGQSEYTPFFLKIYDDRELEFADCLAWLVTLANCTGIDLDRAIQRKYGSGCPGCHATPCSCTREYKP